MCEQGRPEETPYGARFFAGEVSDAYLQREDTQRGYSVVVWRGRHVAEPTELTPEEAITYWLEVLRVGRAIEAGYRDWEHIESDLDLATARAAPAFQELMRAHGR